MLSITSTAASGSEATANRANADVAAALRGGWPLILLAALIGGGVALVAASRMEPSYHAEAVLLFDPPKRSAIPEAEQAPSSDSGEIAALTRSQVEALRSRVLMRQVVDQLGLAKLPAFRTDPAGGFVASTLADLRSVLDPTLAGLGLGSIPAPPSYERSPDQDMRVTLDAYAEHLGVQQDEETYVLRVSFEASDPELAARIANTHAQTYFAWQRQRKVAAIADAARTVNAEAGEQLRRVETAEAAAEGFRRSSNLVEVNSGRTALQEQLAQASIALAAAGTDFSQGEAQLRQLNQLRTAGSTDQLAEALGSPLISSLRDRKAAAQAELARLRRTLGERHPQLQVQNDQIAEMDEAISTETRRIVDGVRAKVELARSRQEQLAKTVASLQGKLQGVESSMTQLRRLDDAATAERVRYQVLSQRGRELGQQIASVQPDALLVSEAQVPQLPNSPRTKLFGAFGLLLSGGLAGLGLSWRERRREVVRTSADAALAADAPCLVQLPRVPVARAGRRAGPVHVLFRDALHLLFEAITAQRRSEEQGIVALIASSLPEEGKSTVCEELVCFGAARGLRTVLLSTDVTSGTPRPRLPRLGPGALAPSRLLVQRDQIGQLPADLPATIADCRRDFDLVVIDTPPVSALADALLLAPHADTIVLLARSCSTPHPLLATVARRLASAGGSVCAVVLTFASLSRSRSQTTGDFGFYYKKNQRYYFSTLSPNAPVKRNKAIAAAKGQHS